MDRKLETFLALCRNMNYRKTAEQLHLTQPAITKQIQALEQEFGTKLFVYDGKELHKTDKCRILETYAISLEYNYRELEMAMHDKKREKLRIGATKTVGDYIIVPAIMRFLKNPDHELSLTVDNTEKLLHMLDENELDFAIIEGTFDKNKYNYHLYRQEPFIGICPMGALGITDTESRKVPRSGKKPETQANVHLTIKDLLSETLIVRETGSGTRKLFEADLASMGYSLDSFARVIELSSFQLIRQAVREGLGISFVYAAVVKDDADLGRFSVDGIQQYHELNTVCLPNTSAKDYAILFLEESEM